MIKKTIWGMVISLFLITGTNTWAQCPDGSSQSGDYCYTVDGGNVTIKKYIGSGSDIVIPSTIDGMSVVSIGALAFEFCTMTSVTIPDSVTSIGYRAFQSCGLTSVTIPDSVTSIGDWAFGDCQNLASVTIPDSVTSIGDFAFYYCVSLTNVTIGNSVTSIGDRAFGDCQNLASVTIPNSVTSIGAYAFDGCLSLPSVTIGNSVASIGYEAFADNYELHSAYFLGNAPTMSAEVFYLVAADFKVCYTDGASGFTSPTWEGYPAEPCASTDNPPVLVDGPFVAAGSWPLLSASEQSPTYFKKNRSVLWTFSDDFASCEDDCTHSAEYSVAGSNSWNTLTVSSDATEGSAWVDLPVSQLQNGTYAFRFAVTDCAGQSTQSGTYYFKVVRPDAPPVITGGPWLAAGSWPLLPTSESRAFVLKQNYYVFWTFSDDYVSCGGLCTHPVSYRNVGDTEWTALAAGTDSEGTDYAYTMLPVAGLDEGTYQFFIDVEDCAGQRTAAPRTYYFKVAAP